MVCDVSIWISGWILNSTCPTRMPDPPCLPAASPHLCAQLFRASTCSRQKFDCHPYHLSWSLVNHLMPPDWSPSFLLNHFPNSSQKDPFIKRVWKSRHRSAQGFLTDEWGIDSWPLRAQAETQGSCNLFGSISASPPWHIRVQCPRSPAACQTCSFLRPSHLLFPILRCSSWRYLHSSLPWFP